MTRPSGPPRRRRVVAAAGAVALVFALGLALGRWSAPGGEASRAGSGPSAARQAAPQRPPGAATPTSAQRDRTREGAARAAAGALRSLADPELLRDPELRRRVVGAIARPGYRDELLPMFDRTYGYLADLLGPPARRGDVVLRMTPLGYDVERFAPGRATVAVWQVTVLATPEREPIGAWSTSRAELVWADGAWRVERFGSDAPGPAPAVTAPATPTPGRLFVDAGRSFEAFP
jgi:hypothetical protein